MSVYKPKNSRHWHFDFQFKGRRFYGSTGCATKRDAERYESEQRRRAALGQDTKPGITMDDACGTWWSDKGQHQASAKTNEYQLANLIAGLGQNKFIADVTVAEIRHYIAKRRAKVANASVNRELEIARRVWKHAADAGFDAPSLEWGKMMLPESQERIRELTEDEERRLFAHLPTDLATVVEFALLSGQRRTSVISLLWAKVDLNGARATVKVKGDKWHTFPLTPRMVAIIANQPKVCPQVFTYECERPAPPRDDRPRRLKGQRYPFSKQGWMRKWRKALTDAKIDDFRFHDLRHTKGTRVLRATGNLKAVQKLLGHADIKTTARYAHALEDDVRAAMMAGENSNISVDRTNTPRIMNGGNKG